MEWLEGKELEAITGRRPKLKEQLDQMREDCTRLDVWKMGERTRPLLLLARMTYKSMGKQEYFLILSNPGGVTVWECPPVMPGATVKHKGGRPPKYGPDAVEIAKEMRAKGETIRGIAEEMEASTATIQKLLKMYQ